MSRSLLVVNGQLWFTFKHIVGQTNFGMVQHAAGAVLQLPNPTQQGREACSVFHQPHRALNAPPCALLYSWTSVRHPLVPYLCRQHCQARAGRNGCHHELGCGRVADARVRPLDEHHLRHLRGARLTCPHMSCQIKQKEGRRSRAPRSGHAARPPPPPRARPAGAAGWGCTRRSPGTRRCRRSQTHVNKHSRVSEALYGNSRTVQQPQKTIDDRGQRKLALFLTQTSAATNSSAPPGLPT